MRAVLGSSALVDDLDLRICWNLIDVQLIGRNRVSRALCVRIGHSALLKQLRP